MLKNRQMGIDLKTINVDFPENIDLVTRYEVNSSSSIIWYTNPGFMDDLKKTLKNDLEWITDHIDILN